MPSTIEPIEVPTAAGTVAVHVFGAGLPTVLWHGLYADGSSWGYALTGLLPGRRLLVVDAPGWGRSARLRLRTGPEHIQAAARDVIDALADGDAVDWLGTGWGGRIGLELAARRPGLVRSVVAAMADPAPMPPEERKRLRRLLALLRVVGPVGPVGRDIVADQLAPDSRVEPQTVGAVLDALLLAGRLQAARAVSRFDLHRPDLTGLLPRITAPVLLVGGDDASPWPEERAAAAAALAPFARATRIDGVRSLVALDRPEALTAAARGFWSTLELP